MTEESYNRAALFLYLAAVALLPWNSFPPFPWLHAAAQWSDPLVAAAALAWVLGERRRLRSLRPSLAEILLALYVAAAVASYALAPPGWGSSLSDLGVVVELAVLAFLTARLASSAAAFRLLVRVVTATSLLAAATAAVGLLLFYVGVETSLVGGYGALVSSSDYARVRAGLPHPALLGSYCIFASAVVAQGQGAISARLRRATQVALGLTVLFTFSRAILGFGLAALIRMARTPALRAAATGATVLSIALMAMLTFTKVSVDPSHPAKTRVSTATEPVRSQELRASVDTLGEHPVVGTGPGSLPGEAVGYGRRQAHNTPVGVAATLGLPALAVLVSLLVALWCGRSRPTNRATWGGLVGLGLDGLGQDIEHFRHVWVMLGVAGAQQRSRIGSARRPNKEDP